MQSQFFASGIRGITTGNPDAIPVVMDSKGQLGTASSSRRVKRDIEDMGDTTEAVLALRPVRFRYQAHGPDSPVQYGLIAEEVAEVAPELVARDKDGRIETVYYDKVNAMLLNEVQKLHRRLTELEGMVRGSGSHRVRTRAGLPAPRRLPACPTRAGLPQWGNAARCCPASRG
jgi:hypothetical protein